MFRNLIFLTAVLSPVVASYAQSAAPKTQTPNVAASSSLSPKKEHALDPRESWTELTMAKSGLDSSELDAVVIDKVGTPEFTRELVRVKWRIDDPIDLYVVLPHGITKPPVILYLYDYTADTDRFRDVGWCKRVTQGGFAAVGFGPALSPQRFHPPRPMKEWFVSEMQEALSTSTHDVQMVLNYLAARNDVDARSVGMFAQGSGGAIAILAASVDPRITALDLFNPWGDWPDWMKGSRQIPENERAELLKPEFLKSVSMLDPIDYLPQLKTKSVRVQQIMDDPVTPTAAKDKIAAAVPKEEVVRYETPEQQALVWRASGLTGWLRAQMRPTPQPAPPAMVVANEQPSSHTAGKK
jgi:hypothetical protein